MTISALTRILVFDQDALGESFLNQTLNSKDYQIIKVNSSAEGISTSQSWHPDVIIINLMQPSSDGWKLCRRLKESNPAPIIVLASLSDPKMVAVWLDAGADDYLIKPFSPEVLVAHIQKLTRRIKLTQNNPSLNIIQ
jgi:two-component system response regulator MtrA